MKYLAILAALVIGVATTNSVHAVEYYWVSNWGASYGIFNNPIAACQDALSDYNWRGVDPNQWPDGRGVDSVSGVSYRAHYSNPASPYYTCNGTLNYTNPDIQPKYFTALASAYRYGVTCPPGTKLNFTTGVCSPIPDEDKGEPAPKPDPEPKPDPKPDPKPEPEPDPCEKEGNPIHSATGNKFQKEEDYLRRGASPLKFVRYYNSAFTMEQHWSHTYALRLRVWSHSAALVQPNGRESFFTITSGIATAQGNERGTLTKLSSGWRYEGVGGEVYTFNTQGVITSIATEQGVISITQTAHWQTGIGTLTATDHLGKTLQLTLSREKQPLQLTIGDYQLTYEYDADLRLTAVNYPDGSKKLYHYNEQAHTQNTDQPKALTGISYQDALGNVSRYATYKYDSNGRAYETGHAGGADVYTLNYTLPGAETEVTGPLGTTQVLTFTEINGTHRLASRSKPAGAGCSASTASMTYDGQGNVASRTGFDGVVTNYTYDLSRNLRTEQKDAAGTSLERTTTTAWHPDWALKAKEASAKRLTHWIYHGQPDPFVGGNASCAPTNLITVNGQSLPVLCKRVEQETTDASGAAGFAATTVGTPRITSYQYNQHGQLLSRDGPRTDVSDIWTYEYWPTNATCPGANGVPALVKGCRGELYRVTNPAGQITEYARYSAHARPLEIVGADGISTLFTYDNRMRIASRARAGKTTSYAYDHRDLLSSVTLPSGRVFEYQYDDAMRLTGILHPQTGAELIYTLDNAGNRLEDALYAQGGTLVTKVNREFDALGRLWKVISAVNGSGAPAVLEHDAEDRLTKDIDPKGNPRHSSYNELGQLTDIIDRAGNSTDFSHDANGVTTEVEAPNGATTTYQVNGFGEITEEVSPDRGTTTYQYDASSNLVTRTDANGVVTQYSYDVLNRLTAITYPAHGSFDAQLSYDATDTSGGPGSATYNVGTGRLTGMQDASGTTTFRYDDQGNLLEDTRVIDVHGGYSLSIQYGYTTNGLLDSITYPNGEVVTYQYDSLGRVTGMERQMPGQSVQTVLSGITYNASDAVASLSWGNGKTLQRTYDLDGRLATQAISGVQSLTYSYDANGNIEAIDDSLSSLGTEYLYDVLDRLTGEDNGSREHAFQYDANGNRLSQTIIDSSGSTTENYVYAPASNRLLSRGGVSYQYDANGNTLSDGTNTYGYAANNRMETANNAVTYRYNTLGQRVSASTSSGTKVFGFGQSGQLLMEASLDAQGAVLETKNYLWLGGQPVAMSQAPAAPGYELVFIHADHLDTPRYATRDSGVVVWRWNGDAFGSESADGDPDQDGVSVAQSLRFPGQYYDQNTGISYNYFRDYDSNTGRYLQSDPIGLRGGSNTYLYVLGNPVRYSDPLGLDVLLCRQPAFGFMPVDHHWLKTDTKEAGMGGMGENGGDAGNQSGDYPGDPVQVTDHSKRNKKGSSCEKIDDVDENKVNELLEIGRPLGNWGPTNQCQSFVQDVLNESRIDGWSGGGGLVK